VTESVTEPAAVLDLEFVTKYVTESVTESVAGSVTEGSWPSP
jgi:hypothetical protein